MHQEEAPMARARFTEHPGHRYLPIKSGLADVVRAISEEDFRA